MVSRQAGHRRTVIPSNSDDDFLHEPPPPSSPKAICVILTPPLHRRNGMASVEGCGCTSWSRTKPPGRRNRGGARAAVHCAVVEGWHRWCLGIVILLVFCGSWGTQPVVLLAHAAAANKTFYSGKTAGCGPVRCPDLPYMERPRFSYAMV